MFYVFISPEFSPSLWPFTRLLFYMTCIEFFDLLKLRKASYTHHRDTWSLDQKNVFFFAENKLLKWKLTAAGLITIREMFALNIPETFPHLPRETQASVHLQIYYFQETTTCSIKLVVVVVLIEEAFFWQAFQACHTCPIFVWLFCHELDYVIC